MLNYYCSFEQKKSKRWVPGVKALTLTLEAWNNMTRNEMTRRLIEEYRAGISESKTKLPAVCWTGTVVTGTTRKAENMMPTGMYMVDIDHIDPLKSPLNGEAFTVQEAWEDIQMTMRVIGEETGYDFKLMLAHITPSGKGLRMVFKCTENFNSLAEHMTWIKETLTLDRYGDFDECVHDISRISFIPQFEDILFINNEIFKAPFPSPIKGGKLPVTSDKLQVENDDVKAQTSNLKFKGIPYSEIIAEYWKRTGGEPEMGERNVKLHKLAVNLRTICDNSREVLMQVMPRFGLSEEEMKQIVESACKEQPKGVTKVIEKIITTPSNSPKGGESEEWLDETESSPFKGDGRGSMPPAPPVIKELISIAPKDFVIPAINSLLPILGTLTSYVRTEDKSNAKTLSTSFFSIIYAPPSSGKSFVERYINLLLRDLFMRDEVNDARDAIYARNQQKKSANDRSEAVPPTSIRIMEAKNSEAEFLEKQRNNHGHHMFTYCSEIDQWRKGIRAAGGNKDDMVRIAWDNGKYGQNFKSSNTFKGKVQLFWNVLIAGTSDQLMAYFKNVTNGLVTRCSFAEIENQQFQSKIPQWGKWTAKDMKVIEAFIERCDRKTYADPLAYNPADCYSVSDEDFDKEVPWHFTFKPFEHVSIDWITRTIEKFNDAQCNKARIDSDEARDTFRRRVAERGKRLALLCTQLYGKPMTKADKELCKKWILWWMRQDIENILKPFGKKYIEAMQEAISPNYRGKTILERLPEEFDANEVRRVADILGYKQRVHLIIYNWVTAGVVEKFANNKWRKVRKEVSDE